MAVTIQQIQTLADRAKASASAVASKSAFGNVNVTGIRETSENEAAAADQRLLANVLLLQKSMTGAIAPQLAVRTVDVWIDSAVKDLVKVAGADQKLTERDYLSISSAIGRDLYETALVEVTGSATMQAIRRVADRLKASTAEVAQRSAFGNVNTTGIRETPEAAAPAADRRVLADVLQRAKLSLGFEWPQLPKVNVEHAIDSAVFELQRVAGSSRTVAETRYPSIQSQLARDIWELAVLERS